MSLLLITLVMPVFAQVDQVSDKDPYILTMQDGTEYYVVIEKEDARTSTVRSVDKSNPFKRQIVKSEYKSLMPSTWTRVAEDIERKLNETTVDIGGGVRVLKDEYARSEAARKKAVELEQRLSPPPLPAPTDAAPAMEATKTEAPGFLAIWGPQLGLLVGAVVLIAIIVKLVIIGE